MTGRSATLLAPERRPLTDRLYDHGQIILALARREVQSRFGQNALGYAWTYVAPLVWIGATYFAFVFLGRTSPVYTDLITFIISGLIPYLGFRLTVSGVGRANSFIRGLLILPAVSHAHAVIALALIELANIFIIFAIVALLNLILFGNGELANPLLFAWGITLAWGLGVAYAYLFSLLTRINPTFHPTAQILLRPTFFISAVFFTANELPQDILAILALNPLLHAVEIARDGMLFHYESRIASSAFVLACIAGLFAVALAVRFVRRP